MITYQYPQLLTVSAALPLTPPSPTTTHCFFLFFFLFYFNFWILCQNSLTGELKIRVVAFVLKKLSARFDMLIVSYALHCVDGWCFVLYLF